MYLFLNTYTHTHTHTHTSGVGRTRHLLRRPQVADSTRESDLHFVTWAADHIMALCGLALLFLSLSVLYQLFSLLLLFLLHIQRNVAYITYSLPHTHD